jgi:hypothetical protein
VYLSPPGSPVKYHSDGGLERAPSWQLQHAAAAAAGTAAHPAPPRSDMDLTRLRWEGYMKSWGRSRCLANTLQLFAAYLPSSSAVGKALVCLSTQSIALSNSCTYIIYGWHAKHNPCDLTALACSLQLLLLQQHPCQPSRRGRLGSLAAAAAPLLCAHSSRQASVQQTWGRAGPGRWEARAQCDRASEP